MHRVVVHIITNKETAALQLNGFILVDPLQVEITKRRSLNLRIHVADLLDIVIFFDFGLSHQMAVLHQRQFGQMVGALIATLDFFLLLLIQPRQPGEFLRLLIVSILRQKLQDQAIGVLGCDLHIAPVHHGDNLANIHRIGVFLLQDYCRRPNHKLEAYIRILLVSRHLDLFQQHRVAVDLDCGLHVLVCIDARESRRDGINHAFVYRPDLVPFHKCGVLGCTLTQNKSS
mmetsp:Transcript_1476/g.2460  ORF Transcript_1476/g.2460 Transcript_1476/m.2460 type:complete len:230 (+) Transcript_1476:115-804(+)